MPDPQVLHDDYGDAITVEADGIATVLPGYRTSPPAVLVTFWDSPVMTEDARDFIRMRLSGERLTAFTEALDCHAASLAAITEGGDDGVR